MIGTPFLRLNAYKVRMEGVSLWRGIEQIGIWSLWPESIISLMIITQGRPNLEEVANIANESVWEFWPLGICLMERTSKLDWACLTLLRYPCIRWSLALNYPLTCPTTILESEKTFTTFPSSLLTIAIPTNKTSYRASLFVARNLNVKDFSTIIFLGDIKTIPTPDHFWLAAPSV